jgi:WD40 repeat protein
MSFLVTLLAATIVALSSVYARNTSPLHLEKEIPLPGVWGRIDHFSADVRGQRLFIAALENGTVEVIDIRKGERSTEIKGLSEPQGVFYSSQNDELYVASGGDGTLRIYDETTLKLRQTLEFGADADNVRYGGHSEDLRRQKPSFTKSCNLRDDGPTKHVSRADPGLQCCATSKVSACQVSGLRHSERTRCVPLK